MMRRGALAWVFAAAALLGVARNPDFPKEAEIITPYDEEIARAALVNRGAQPLEGIWYYPDELITLCIERYKLPSSNIEYRIILLDSEDLSLLPGTVVGYAARSAVANEFDMWIYTQHSSFTLINPHRCVGELSADYSTLKLRQTELKVKIRVNFAQFLPTIFRGVSVVPQVNTESVPRGMTKIYPALDDNGTPWRGIRYL